MFITPLPLSPLLLTAASRRWLPASRRLALISIFRQTHQVDGIGTACRTPAYHSYDFR